MPTDDQIVELGARALTCDEAYQDWALATIRRVLGVYAAAGLVLEQGWQPIETAPDAAASPQRVLVYDPRLNEPVQIRGSDGGFWRYEGVGPTHWRPLPTPPATGGET